MRLHYGIIYLFNLTEKKNELECTIPKITDDDNLYEPRSTANDDNSNRLDLTDNNYDKIRLTPQEEQVKSLYPQISQNGVIYSELGKGGRDPKDVTNTPVVKSNYADARDIYSYNERDSSPVVKRKDIFDPVEEDWNDQDREPFLNKDKVFKSPPSLQFESIDMKSDQSSMKSTKSVNPHLIDGKYPEGYIKNEGRPVYEDPMESMINNPPTWEYHDRQAAPGGEKRPPIAYPKFNRP